MYKSKIFLTLFVFFGLFLGQANSSDKELLKVDWSFKGITGKFDRASLQRVIKFTQKFVHHAIL